MVRSVAGACRSACGWGCVCGVNRFGSESDRPKRSQRRDPKQHTYRTHTHTLHSLSLTHFILFVCVRRLACLLCVLPLSDVVSDPDAGLRIGATSPPQLQRERERNTTSDSEPVTDRGITLSFESSLYPLLVCLFELIGRPSPLSAASVLVASPRSSSDSDEK